MKKSIIALFIVFLFVSALSAYSADEGNAETSTSEENALDYQESYEQGFFDARSTYDGGNWGWYGFGGGLLLNLVGAGIIVAVASMETINPKHIPDNVERMAYIQGYEEQAQKINLNKSLIGAAVGLGASVVVYVVLYAAVYAAAIAAF